MEEDDLLSELRSLGDEPEPRQEIEFGETASYLRDAGFFDDLVLDQQIARRSESEEARDKSSLGVLGSWDTLDDARRSTWVTEEKSAAKDSESFWGGMRDAATSVRDRTPVVPPQVGIASAVRPVIDWATRKSGEMVAQAQRRQIVADQMEAGVKAGPRTGITRRNVETLARSFGEGVGSIAAGAGRFNRYAADALFGRGIDDSEARRLAFAENKPFPDEVQVQRGVVEQIRDAYTQTAAREGSLLSKGGEIALRSAAAVQSSLGNFIIEKSREIFPEDEARQYEFMTKLSQGAGSMLAFMGPTLTATVFTKAGPKVLARIADEFGTEAASKFAEKQAVATAYTTSGTLGAAMQAESEAKGAEAAGADYNATRNVFLLNIPGGASEAVPIGHLFASPTGRLLNRIFAEGGEEFSQEFGQQVASNIIAQKFYDPERKWDDGAWESAAVGFILGSHAEMARSGYYSARLGKQQPSGEGTGGKEAPAAPSPAARRSAPSGGTRTRRRT